MRMRLRPAMTAAELAAVYAVPHDHTRFPDHLPRVDCTISLARALCRATAAAPSAVADLSCGDAAIARALDPVAPILGDLAPGYPLTGPIEETITTIGHVELFVLSETLEHLDNPDKVLAQVREHARLLIMSTPLAEFASTNPEHYWAWDQDGVREMLTRARWIPVVSGTVVTPGAAFQIWGCR